MKDLVFKIKILFYEVFFAIRNWKDEVWSVELDSEVCCSGKQYEYPCGCMGTTHRERINWEYLQRTTLS